jgi:hypothetical protein
MSKPKRIRKEISTDLVSSTPAPIVAKPEVTQSPQESLEALCSQLPEAKMIPEQRWYGETFYPQYTRVLDKIKALLKK